MLSEGSPESSGAKRKKKNGKIIKLKLYFERFSNRKGSAHSFRQQMDRGRGVRMWVSTGTTGYGERAGHTDRTCMRVKRRKDDELSCESYNYTVSDFCFAFSASAVVCSPTSLARSVCPADGRKRMD